jgi:hypothetical protein
MSWTQQDISFKYLLNKRESSSGKAFYEEFGDDTLNTHIANVWIETIADNDPAQALIDGVAEIRTSFLLTEDTSVPNNQCYYAYDSSGPGVRLKDWIGDKFGSNYAIHLYQNDGTEIFPTDNCQWLFSYQTGILIFNGSTSSFAKPFKITGYRYIGTKGLAGIPVGQTGLMGPTGIFGGPQGVTGLEGLGITGIYGHTGITGPTGVQGQGVTGLRGVTGLQGNTGFGFQGTTGIIGEGVTGLQGFTGYQGNTGLKGDPGIGIQGSQGATGLRGMTGITGSTGVQGLGVTGLQGLGVTGLLGATGIMGITGLRGTTGLGVTGLQGNTGFGSVGSQGLTGLMGFTGFGAGVTGLQGNTGVGSGGGLSGPLYAEIYSYQALNNGTQEAWIKSSGTMITGLSWTRSSTTCTITHSGHGLSDGDYVICRNINQDYIYSIVSGVTGSTFDVTVLGSGSSSGSSGAYAGAYGIASAAATGCTINPPNASSLVGDIQIISMNFTTGSRSSGGTVTISIPITIKDGGTSNNTLNSNMFMGYLVSDPSTGGNIAGVSYVLTASTVQITGMVGTSSRTVRLSF